MTFFDSKGRKKTIKSPSKYLIDWDGKSLSKFQKAAKDFLRSYWKFDYVFEEFPVVGTRSRLDFYNASKRIALEIQGRQHSEFVPHFQKTRANFLSQIKRDLDKQTFCDNNNIVLIEVSEISELTEEFFLENGVSL